jgi:hypothetical protein
MEQRTLVWSVRPVESEIHRIIMSSAGIEEPTVEQQEQKSSDAGLEGPSKKSAANEEIEEGETAQQLMARFLAPIRKEFRLPKKPAAQKKEVTEVSVPGPVATEEKKDAQNGDMEEQSAGDKRVRQPIILPT